MASHGDHTREITRQIGFQRLGVHVFSHPRFGVSASLGWDRWEGSRDHKSTAQVKYDRDTGLASWSDALDILETMIAMARRQIALLDESEQ